MDAAPPAALRQASSRPAIRASARAAGLHPDYWYAVETARSVSHRLSRSRSGIVRLRSTAGLTGASGRWRTAAHRQLKLSLGQVEGCNLNCTYHGWSYDEAGRVASIPHELFGHGMPCCASRSYRHRFDMDWSGSSPATQP